MIGVDEAFRLVIQAAARLAPLPSEEVLLDQALGRVLRETVTADQDMPPFTRSAMDGYALRSADLAALPATLEVIEEIPAGAPPRRAIGPGQASKIMTGAALPDGADAVQMVERTRGLDEGRVLVLSAVGPGDNVRRAGEDLRRGAVLVKDGTELTAAHVALLASAGRDRLGVSRRARVAVIPTGDELVPVHAQPGPSQIRESNGTTLCCLVRLAGGLPDLVETARDSLADLTGRIGQAMAVSDAVLLSGGVSMGDYDLVGRAMAELGCRQEFDRVAIQPGKPLTFAVGGGRERVLLFGLPGNPVSTVVDFLVFARPALRRLMGCGRWEDSLLEVCLAEAVQKRPGRRAYLPAALLTSGPQMTARLLPSRGSADMVAFARADVLAILPEDAERLEAGVRVRALPLAGLTGPGGGAPYPGPGSAR